MNNNFILLEFNEEQQNFHYNKITNGVPEKEINTNGYKELFVCRNEEEANLFCDFLYVQFGLLDNKKLKFKEALHTLQNLSKFIDAYKLKRTSIK